MSIPNPPNFSDLRKNLINLTGVTKGFNRKTVNWNIPHVNRVTSRFSSRDFKKLAQFAQAMNEQKEMLGELKRIKQTTNAATESKKAVEGLLSKVPGGGNAASKAAKAGGSLAAIIGIGGVAGIVALAVKQMESNQAQSERGLDILAKDLSKNLSLMTTIKSKVDRAEKQIAKQKLENSRLDKKIFEFNTKLQESSKKSNDALYEVRQGRNILQQQINANNKQALDAKTQALDAKKQANDALYEVRQDRTKLQTQIDELTKKTNAYLGDLQKSAVQRIQETVNKIQVSLEVNTAKVKKVEDTVNVQAKVVETASQLAKAMPAAITRAVNVSQDSTKKIVEAAINPIQNIGKKWGVTVTPATVTPATVTVAETGALTVTPATVTPATVTYADFSSSEIGQTITQADEKLTSADEKLRKQDEVLAGGLAAFAAVAHEARITANAAMAEAKIKGSIMSVVLNLDPLKAEVTQLQSGLKQAQTDLKQIDKKLAEDEKMNRQGLFKLDQIIGALPGIPQQTANKINPNVPNLPDIKRVTGEAVCEAGNGCMKNNFDDIKNNSNNNKNDLLNALNAGLQIPELALLKTIDSKLGAQVEGGLSGKLGKFTRWLQLDRVLNLMIFGATVHNALMLSNDIGQTLLGAIGNVLQLFGLKDEEGKAFDLGSIISTGFENMIKSIIGAENYTELKVAWAKANRIYQATTNILNSFQGLASTILTALEMGFGQVSKIGNALRSAGEVLDSAYNWMNPQPKYNRVIQTLEKLQNGASTIQQVTQAPLDIIQATTELTNSATELTKAIKEDDKDENKGKEAPEPDKLKADKAESKAASAGKEVSDSDLEADE